MERLLRNPVLPGFYPDPSVCRKGEDYYLVTSTFEYFPGIPVFHSRDFVHWRQLGNALDRPGQLNLDNLPPSKGIYASSIFYHEGRDLFYIVTTLVGKALYWDNVNFLVWAQDPAGPWSDPVVIQGAEGIDPSLVFDGGTAYYLGNRRSQPDRTSSNRHIWLQELDLDTGALLGERHTLLTDGALHGAKAPEGPHIYKVGGWYYLLIAEGGTDYNHAVSVFRSRALTGPYEGNPRNPVLTHRDMKRDSAFHSTGHADLIRLANGEWWAVLLACRPCGGPFRNLGRETCAVPVAFEEEWPVFSPDTGRVEATFPAPALPQQRWIEPPTCEQFEGETLPPGWISPRTPRHTLYSLGARPGWLRLFLHPSAITQAAAPSFVGVRQRHFCFCLRTVMEFSPAEGETAGLVLLMNHDYHIRFELGCYSGRPSLRVARRFAGAEDIIVEIPCEAGRLYLMAQARYQDFSFYYATRPENWTCLAAGVDGTLLCKEAAGGYTGTVLGLYASANGAESANHADFDWFEYQPLPD